MSPADVQVTGRLTTVPVDRSLTLPAGQFVDEVCSKDLIVLHHTVGGSARSTFEYWRATPERIGTAFIVERDGTVYQTFPEDRWAWHLGLKGADAAGGRHDRRSIGIEIASEGALFDRGGVLHCFGVTGRVYPRGQAVDLGPGKEFRGFRYFDAYDPAQLRSTLALVNALLLRYPTIPRRTVRNHALGPSAPLQSVGGAPLADRLSFRGVLGHTDLRADKSDPHLLFPWGDLARACDLEVVP